MSHADPNFLEGLDSDIKRKKYGVIDLESKSGDTQQAGFTRVFLAGIYDGTNYVSFRNEPHLAARQWTERSSAPGGCIDKTMTFCTASIYRGFVWYAHNGGNFDWLHILDWIRRHDDEYGFEVVPVQSSIQVIRMWRKPVDPDDPIKDKWTFLDSMKLYPSSLKNLLKTFKIAPKVEHDLHMHEEDAHWGKYLKQDCVGLFDGLAAIHDLVENKLRGEVGMTAPATAMKTYRRRFMQGQYKRIARHIHWPDCPHKSPPSDGSPSPCRGCAHDWIRRGYYGGRTEMFRSEGTGLRYYDYVSSYPASMLEGMPVGDRIIEDHLDWRRHETMAGFVECTVYVPPECHIPPLPYRAEKTGKLIFPAGTFRGVWSCEELKLLEDPFVNGRIVAVSKVVWFKKKPVFREMVEEFWSLRDKSLPGFDEGLSAMAKLILNSLYGKFGMRQERTQIVFAFDQDAHHCILCKEVVEEGERICAACEGSKPAADIGPGHDVWYQRKCTDASYIVPQIAAHITALSRVRLWKGMKATMDAGGEVYYTDTDSQLCDVVMPSSTRLGELKDEYPGQTLKGTFLQPKVYMIEVEDPGEKREDKLTGLRGKHGAACLGEGCKGCARGTVTMKGFPPRLRTPENLAKLRAGEVLTYENLEKVRTLARLGFARGPRMRDDEHPGGPVKKSFRGKYDKRILHEDGTTSPIVLNLPFGPDEERGEVEGVEEAAAE